MFKYIVKLPQVAFRVLGVRKNRGEKYMIAYASLFSHDDEEKYGIANVSGAHFYQDTDPKNPDNKILRVHICSSESALDSTVHLLDAGDVRSPSAAEFEMKYYFNSLSEVVSPLCFSLEFRSESGARLFSLSFSAVDFLVGGSTSRIAITTEDGRNIEGAVLNANTWYQIRTEYYQNEKSPEESRLKIYLGSDGERPTLLADVTAGGRVGVISRAALVYSAEGINGTHFFDDISFRLTDKKYSSLYETELSHLTGEIYDFEDGIPSDRRFHIEMMLKRDGEAALFDPATWANAAINATPSRRSYTEILLVLSGDGLLKTEDNGYPFNEGDIFVIAPGYNRSIISDHGYKILSIAGEFNQLSFIGNIATLRDNVYSEGKKLAELTLYNRFGNESYVNALCDAYIKFITINLERQPKNIISAIHRIIENIERNFSSSDLSIGELLAESGYAKDYVRCEFFSVTKMTPKKYLTGVRMKNAKALFDLYGKDMGISEVAEQCGIIDSSVFSRVFKQYYGVSPSEYLTSRKK